MDKPTRLLVLNDLAVLRLLAGVIIEVPAAPAAAGRGVRARQQEASSPSGRPTIPRAPSRPGRADPALKARLEADLRRTECDDPWTVLGVRRGALKAEVDAWCDRMLQRYATILGRDLDPETRRLAVAMHLRVRNAAAEIRKVPTAAAPAAPRIRPIDEVGREDDLETWDGWKG